jgi:hypothetical protein
MKVLRRSLEVQVAIRGNVFQRRVNTNGALGLLQRLLLFPFGGKIGGDRGGSQRMDVVRGEIEVVRFELVGVDVEHQRRVHQVGLRLGQHRSMSILWKIQSCTGYGVQLRRNLCMFCGDRRRLWGEFYRHSLQGVK